MPPYLRLASELGAAPGAVRFAQGQSADESWLGAELVESCGVFLPGGV